MNTPNANIMFTRFRARHCKFAFSARGETGKANAPTVFAAACLDGHHARLPGCLAARGSSATGRGGRPGADSSPSSRVLVQELACLEPKRLTLPFCSYLVLAISENCKPFPSTSTRHLAQNLVASSKATAVGVSLTTVSVVSALVRRPSYGRSAWQTPLEPLCLRPRENTDLGC